MADIRFLFFEGKFIFLDQKFFVDAVIYEIPWKDFIQTLGSVDKEIGIDFREAKSARPVPVMFMG
jgi:hypothetical protein